MSNIVIKEKDHFYAKVFAIALPIAFQNIITSSLNLIDTFMISALSTEAIAGVSLANKVFFLLFLTLFGISSGSSILTAQYWGIKDVKNIRKVLGICLTFGVAAATLFTLGALFAPELIMRIFSPDALVIEEGVSYLRIIAFSYIVTSISFAYVFILRSTGNVKLPVTVTVIAIVINTFLNWVLIYGNLGAPAMGVRGAAIATVIARVFECILLLSVIYLNRLPAAGKFKEMFSFRLDFVKKYLVTVMPVIGNEMMWALGVTMYDIVYGHMGGAVTASMGITKSVEQFTFFLVWGVGNAAGVVLGNALGAGDKELAYDYAKRLMKFMIMIGIAVGVVVALLAIPISNLFNVEEIVKINIRNCLYVLAVFGTIKALNMLIIVGILRSGGDTTYCMILDAGAVWLVAVPIAFFAGWYLKLEIHWVYALVMSEEVVKVFFGYMRTHSKKWLKNLVA